MVSKSKRLKRANSASAVGIARSDNRQERRFSGKEISLTIRLPDDLKQEFFSHCEDNEQTISQRIRYLMKRDLKGLYRM